MVLPSSIGDGARCFNGIQQSSLGPSTAHPHLCFLMKIPSTSIAALVSADTSLFHKPVTSMSPTACTKPLPCVIRFSCDRLCLCLPKWPSGHCFLTLLPRWRVQPAALVILIVRRSLSIQAAALSQTFPTSMHSNTKQKKTEFEPWPRKSGEGDEKNREREGRGEN